MENNKFRYTNETCPVCNTPFNEDDDIAVCPQCGTPHHRQCYLQNGTCGNENRHADGFRWQSQTPEQETDQTHEETQNPFTQTINGQPFVFPPHDTRPLNLFPEELEEGVSTTDVAFFVQQEEVKYVQKFFYIKGGKKTWNWAAFFFNPYWFFYRKLYKLGAIFMAITFALSLLSFLPPVTDFIEDMAYLENKMATISQSDSEEYEKQAETLALEIESVYKENALGIGIVFFQSAASFVLSVVAGRNANKWYYKYVTEQIRTINGKNYPPQEKQLAFLQLGSVSYGKAFLAVLVERTLSFVLQLILQI